MYLILSGITLCAYMYACYYLFQICFNYFSRLTNDFILQIFPSWILLSIIIGVTIIIYPTFLYAISILRLTFYISIIICFICIILLFVKMLNKNLYDILVEKIKSRNR